MKVEGVPEVFGLIGRLTWSGVDLFFVLSGFLLGGTLLDARDSPNYFTTFYARRFFRIVPLYAAVCILWTWSHWMPVTSGLVSKSLCPWYAYATFTQNIWSAIKGHLDLNALGVTWSLAVEEQFYLFLPLFMYFSSGLSRRRLVYLLGGMVLAVPILRAFIYAFYDKWGAANFVLMPCRADALLLGVLGAVMVRSKSIREVLCRNPRWFLAVLGIGGAGLAIFTGMKWTTAASPQMSIVGYSWLAFFYLTLLLFTVLRRNTLWAKMMRHPLLMQMGSISYCVYLIHLAVISMFYKIAGAKYHLYTFTDAIFALAAVAIVVVVAKLSWVLFERPLVRIGHRFKY